MKHSIAIAWLVTILGLIFFWPIGIIGLCISLYITVKNRLIQQQQAKELKRQREMERKELEMARKSNEVLLHLMQDGHREEGR